MAVVSLKHVAMPRILGRTQQPLHGDVGLSDLSFASPVPSLTSPRTSHRMNVRCDVGSASLRFAALCARLLSSKRRRRLRSPRHDRLGRPGEAGAAVLDTPAFAGAKRKSAERCRYEWSWSNSGVSSEAIRTLALPGRPRGSASMGSDRAARAAPGRAPRPSWAVR